MAAPVMELFMTDVFILGTSYTIDLGETVANHILVLVNVCRADLAAPSITGTYDGGAWTEFLADDGANLPGAGCYWSRCTGNHIGQTVVVANASANSMAGGIIQVSGCITSGSPIDTNTNSRRDNASPDVNTLTGFDTTVAETLVVLATGGQDNISMSGWTKNAVSMNEAGEALNDSGSDSCVGIATLAQTAAGATGDFNFTQDLGVNDAKWIFAFALKPPETSFSITPPVGGLSASGIAGILGYGLTTVVGALTAAGVAATFAITLPITPLVGTLTASGVESSLDFGMTPGVGTLTASGLSPPLDFGLTPSATSLTLNGLAPTLDFGITPSQGILSLSGLAPTLDLGITPSAGLLTLLGYAPTLDVSTGDANITPSVGVLTLSGNAPILEIPGAITVPVGTLTLSGYSPLLSVEGNVQITPGTCSLVLTGQNCLLVTGAIRSLYRFPPESRVFSFTADQREYVLLAGVQN